MTIEKNNENLEENLFTSFLKRYPNRISRIPNTGVFIFDKRPKNKVGLLSGGGSGHEPADVGFLGKGMLDVCVMGKIFTPPTGKEVFEGIKQADQGHGVLVIIKNFEEDIRTFTKGIDLARQAGHRVESVLVNDDCSVEDLSFKKRRRGVAGTILVQKILGSASLNEKNIDKLKALGDALVSSLNTLGVAFEAGTLPNSQQPMFELTKGFVSYGVGIHGEKGYREEPFHGTEVLAIEIWNKLKSQSNLQKKDRVAVLVNGLGGTAHLELDLFSQNILDLIQLDEIKCDYIKVGNYMTSLDMKGVSVSTLPLKDKVWLSHLESETDAPAWI